MNMGDGPFKLALQLRSILSLVTYLRCCMLYFVTARVFLKMAVFGLGQNVQPVSKTSLLVSSLPGTSHSPPVIPTKHQLSFPSGRTFGFARALTHFIISQAWMCGSSRWDRRPSESHSPCQLSLLPPSSSYIHTLPSGPWRVSSFSFLPPRNFCLLQHSKQPKRFYIFLIFPSFTLTLNPTPG